MGKVYLNLLFLINFRSISQSLFNSFFFFFFVSISHFQVGAPPEIANLLDEIGRESGDLCQRSACLGADPELDGFMVSFSDNSLFFRIQ